MPATTASHETLLLTRGDVRQLLSLDACIDEVEEAFRQHAAGRCIPSGVLGTPVPGGGFHVKTAGLSVDGRPMFASKVNANFPGNPLGHGLPTIQGVLVLFDAEVGRPLAIIDSIEITSVRTAAASAVAARYLAPRNASTVTICGCGEQGRAQLRALARVLPVRHVLAFDRDQSTAEAYADEMTSELGMSVRAVDALNESTRASEIWVTCTPARRWFLGRDHVSPGATIFAVGADNHTKQEIEPELLAASTVVVDVLDQCASIGDLHHAIDAGVMRREDVHAELSDIVSGRRAGRVRPGETIVFDSTGTALEDVAAARLVYERALASGAGLRVDLAGASPAPDADGELIVP